MEDRYFDRWPTDTGINWWDEGRKELNKAISLVNDWTLSGCPEEDADKILKHLDMGLQTFGVQDGGESWADELRKMQQYIQEKRRLNR